MDVSARSQDTFGAGYHERIAHSKTTHDHALRRGTYRSKRRRGGGAFSGWRLALPWGLFAIIIAAGALLLIGAGAALAFFAGDLPSPQDLAKDPLAQSTKVYDRTGTQLLYQFSEENREVVSYEAILAVEVTNTYSKQQILELYFNQIYYGNQAYGEKAAAQTYFGKSDLSKLTLAEAALLAGLPQAPSVLDPTQAHNVDRAAERR